MISTHRFFYFLIALALTAGTASAQVATGTPPFGSFAGGPDVINLADLNSHWGYGMVAKAGRGIGFHDTLGFDNTVWKVGDDGSGHSIWQPVKDTFGWIRQTEALTGYVT